MEGVDDIILHALRRLGCNIDDSILNLKQLSTESVVEATVKCLRQVLPEFTCSEVLPVAMSARFRVGMALAQACTDLGYTKEIGYQTFLYWNDTDMRSVLMFLLEKLPREADKGVSEPLGEMTLLHDEISKRIHQQLQTPWSPLSLCILRSKKCRFALLQRQTFRPAEKFQSVRLRIPNSTDATSTMQLITDQPVNHCDVCPSLIEMNMASLTAAQEKERLYKEELAVWQKPKSVKQNFQTREKVKAVLRQEFAQGALHADGQTVRKLAPGNAENNITRELLQSKDAENPLDIVIGSSIGSQSGKKNEEEIERDRAEEINVLKAELDHVENAIKEALLDGRKMTASSQKMKRHLAELQSSYTGLKDSYTIKKTTFELLPAVDTNMIKLQSVIEASSQRLVSLLTQWEKHRAPLVQQYRELKEDNVNKLSETRMKIDEIKLLREKMKEITTEAHSKEYMHAQLMKEHEKLARDMNRSTYTHRIMEIIGNIKKQKLDIDKVLMDTKAVQKEINQLSGKLERTFTVTDELIFKDAKKDEAVRKTYKYLAALHENCNQLVKTVEETGTIMREIRDLEDQIESESHRKVLANLERITADYNQMKQENATLMGKVKGNHDTVQ